MYCKKCKYISFDHLAACPKCGQDWIEEKKMLGLDGIKTGEKSWLDPSLMAPAEVEEEYEQASFAADDIEFKTDEYEEASDADMFYHGDLDSEPEVEVVPQSKSEPDPDMDPGFEKLEHALHENDTEPDFEEPEFEIAESDFDKVDQDIKKSEAADEHAEESTELIEPGLEPDLDFPGLDLNEQKMEKSADNREEIQDAGTEYEIEYPNLEFIESEKKQ